MNSTRRSFDEQVLETLVAEATQVRLRAHAPYSQFQVGAALLTASGHRFAGCNVENASFSLTICAERVAASTAVASGQRDWIAIAIVSPGGVTPCGACRQYLAEFGQDLLILCVDVQTQSVKRFQLSKLLPHAFDLNSLP